MKIMKREKINCCNEIDKFCFKYIHSVDPSSKIIIIIITWWFLALKNDGSLSIGKKRHDSSKWLNFSASNHCEKLQKNQMLQFKNN